MSAHLKKKIINFIKTNLKKKHILFKNSKVFNYYYISKNKLNFIIDSKNGNIRSILGYIPGSKYNKKSKTIWIALWISSKDYPTSGLGNLKKLQRKFDDFNIACLGLTRQAKKILQIVKFKTGTMLHFYLANKNITKYFIIKNPRIQKENKVNNNFIFIKKLTKKNVNVIKTDIENKEKNIKYFTKKYLNNPFYHYQIFLIRYKKINGIFVIRIINSNNSRAARIIDFEGNMEIVKYSSIFFLKFIKKNKCEYIDFVNYGIKKEFLKSAGFTKLKRPTVIPNFFEPLIIKNHRIYFAYKQNNKLFTKKFFKGDGDQERPNLL
jgi:hypothetical protein